MAQLKILDTRAEVLVSGGWFEGNGGDGIVIEEAVGARIRDLRMGGYAARSAVHIKGPNHCWSHQVKGLMVATRDFAEIMVQETAGVLAGNPVTPFTALTDVQMAEGRWLREGGVI